MRHAAFRPEAAWTVHVQIHGVAMAYEPELAVTVERLRGESVLSVYFMSLMALSGVLAAVALLTSSIPVLLGAMLIAPVFPPLALIAVGLVLGRWPMAGRGLVVAVAGLVLAVLFAVVTTWFLNVIGIIPAGTNLFQRELLEERVRPGWYSVAAALAAGLAGMLGMIRNKTDTLIGTIASVALVPAGGAAGIALVSGDRSRAIGGLVLLTINILLIVATGMIVLLAIGRGRPMATGRS